VFGYSDKLEVIRPDSNALWRVTSGKRLSE
jgi:hypothetical protein